MSSALFFSALAQGFVVTGVKPSITAPRTASPAMVAPDGAMITTLNTMTTMTVAEDNTLLLASGGLIGFLFLFAVVGTIVTNFGIMKKK
jgi:hypothetical protein